MENEPDIQVAVSDDRTICDKCCYTFCHPSGTAHRFIALIFMCFLGFGSYFCYDNPSALKEHFTNHSINSLNITDNEYTGLYSIYSWPNVIMCFIGGFLIDRILGIRAGTNIFMGFTLLGQLIFSFATLWNQLWLMYIGRFIFGIGAESLAVAQNNYAVLWFKGKELNMVFGLQLSFARVGSTVNFWVMEPVYNWLSERVVGGNYILGYALLIAATTCLLSMLCSLILGAMDKRVENLTNRADIRTTDIVKITDVKDFKLTFWLLTIICVTYYIAIFPFISIGQGFFITRFNMTDTEADRIISLIYLISGVGSPLTGILLDKTGLNVFWIFLSMIITIISHTLLGFTSVNPYIGVVMLGISYSGLASGLWPMVSLIIPEHQLGTAFGVCQSLQNLGLAVALIIVGSIIENWGYRLLSEFFIFSLMLSLATTGFLLLLDKHEGGILNLTPGGRKRYQNQLLNDVMERQRILTAEVLPNDGNDQES